ncbi:hypothetical protein [Mycobacterium malmoense]|uniref:hypothetical protein n=1 Tax=Mycobacterium malmoense TaxID=1780 RepID=UPI00114D4B72|nr:hypothetical protein [Mycobacterium malmoense]
MGAGTGAADQPANASTATVTARAAKPVVHHECITGVQSRIPAQQQSASARMEPSGSANTWAAWAEECWGAANPACER